MTTGADGGRLSAVNLPRLDIVFDRNTLSFTSGPSSSRSTWALGTVTGPWSG